MIEKNGVATNEQVKLIFPDIKRINKGSVAVIECYEEIPCNPCFKSCKFDAISDLTDINDIPVVDTEKCTGCGICVYNCPGLAIMMVDGSKSEDYVVFRIPYEFLPLPEENQEVQGLNRKGEYITDAKVLKVQNSKTMDRTPIIHVQVDRRHMYDFRNIRIGDMT